MDMFAFGRASFRKREKSHAVIFRSHLIKLSES